MTSPPCPNFYVSGIDATRSGLRSEGIVGPGKEFSVVLARLIAFVPCHSTLMMDHPILFAKPVLSRPGVSDMVVTISKSFRVSISHRVGGCSIDSMT